MSRSRDNKISQPVVEACDTRFEYVNDILALLNLTNALTGAEMVCLTVPW